MQVMGIAQCTVLVVTGTTELARMRRTSLREEVCRLQRAAHCEKGASKGASVIARCPKIE